MGILINQTSNKSINILDGSNSTVNSVYGRINFKAYPNGKTLEIGTDIYIDKPSFVEGITLACDLPNGNFFVEIDNLTETQSLDVAHIYAIHYFEQLGYQCEVI